MCMKLRSDILERSIALIQILAMHVHKLAVIALEDAPVPGIALSCLLCLLCLQTLVPLRSPGGIGIFEKERSLQNSCIHLGQLALSVPIEFLHPLLEIGEFILSFLLQEGRIIRPSSQSISHKLSKMFLFKFPLILLSFSLHLLSLFPLLSLLVTCH